MTKRAEPQGAGKLIIDLGPLLVFFLVNFLAPVPAVLKIFVATGAFMVAIAAAMLFSGIRYGRISPLLWFSGIMVLVLGGLTIVLHKEWIIKIKPTIYYTILAGTLGFGLATDRPLLQQVLGSAYPGLSAEGWRKLTRNWALFFGFLALVNEAVWRNVSTDAWIAFKLWFVAPATLVFAAANIPMLLKHGLMRDEATPLEPGPIE